VAPVEHMVRLQADDLAHLRTDTGSHFVRVGSITAIQAELNYTLVHLDTGMRHLVRRSLKSWEDQLDEKTFVRIGRDAVVNLAHVMMHTRDENKSGDIQITGRREPLHVSRRYWARVRSRLQRE
jgi:DNA-binding LytR/AlgR family response regulator